MLSIFKKKPILAQLIPDHYVDIHSHCLPAIDDGAQHIGDSFELLLGMQNLGFNQVIATPHTFPGVWNNTKESIEGAYKIITKEQPELTQSLSLGYASEYLLSDEVMEQSRAQNLLCIKERHVLVEMSYLNPPLALYDMLFQLKQDGYLPIMAHPERYSFFHDDFKQYEKLKAAGCMFQLNLLSTVGYYGTSVTTSAEKLLARGMIDFVGSDIHHQRHISSFQSKLRVKSVDALEHAFSQNSYFAI